MLIAITELYISVCVCFIYNIRLANPKLPYISICLYFAIQAVEKCKSIRHLDVGENRVGSSQNAGGQATTRQNKFSGGTVLAKLLENSTCRIEVLKVPWNVIRFNDGVTFCRSIKDNINLTHLDVSFNAIGEDGGMALGDALHTNKVLKYLNLSNNSINPAACFSIAAGILSCRSLEQVILSNNPICEDGGRAIMMVVALIGHNTKIDISGCSLHGKDQSSYCYLLLFYIYYIIWFITGPLILIYALILSYQKLFHPSLAN